MRADIRAAARVFVGCVLVSLVGAVLWGLLVPAEHVVVVTADRGAVLTNESQHTFDAIAIFMCIAAAVGLLSAVAAWQWRSRRGPLMVLGLLAGCALGAKAMSIAGEGVAHLHYPHVSSPRIGSVVAVAPDAVTMPTLIVAPLIATLVLLVLASVNPREDLGAEPYEHSDSVAAEPVISS